MRGRRLGREDISATLFGAPLGSSLVALTTAGTALPVVLGVTAVVLAVATLSSRLQAGRAAAVPNPAGRAATDSTQVWLARLLPYGLLVSAAVVPLALTLVLVTSSAWVVAERTLLRA